MRVAWVSVSQIIGETATGEMLNVNPTKSKELTNFRNKGKEDHIVLQVCSRPQLYPTSTLSKMQRLCAVLYKWHV